MDRPQRKLRSTSARLTAMAVSLVGSAHEVMAAMKCSVADFLEYCDGRKEPPWPEFDRLISLIVHEQGIMMAKNRKLLDEMRTKKAK